MLPGQFFDQIPYLQNLFRVESHHRFVQNQHLRIADQRLRQPYTLLIPFGKISDQPSSGILQLRSFNNLFHMLHPFFPRYFLEFRHKHQILIYRHIRIERWYFREIANALFRLLRLCQDIEPIDLHRSASGGDITRHDIHCRGFSRTVRPKKTINLSFLYSKRQIFHRRVVSVFFAYILYLYQNLVPPF